MSKLLYGIFLYKAHVTRYTIIEIFLYPNIQINYLFHFFFFNYYNGHRLNKEIIIKLEE